MNLLGWCVRLQTLVVSALNWFKLGVKFGCWIWKKIVQMYYHLKIHWTLMQHVSCCICKCICTCVNLHLKAPLHFYAVLFYLLLVRTWIKHKTPLHLTDSKDLSLPFANLEQNGCHGQIPARELNYPSATSQSSGNYLQHSLSTDTSYWLPARHLVFSAAVLEVPYFLFVFTSHS